MPTFSETSFAKEKINKQPGLEWPELGQSQMAFPVFKRLQNMLRIKKNVDIA